MTSALKQILEGFVRIPPQAVIDELAHPQGTLGTRVYRAGLEGAYDPRFSFLRHPQSGAWLVAEWGQECEFAPPWLEILDAKQVAEKIERQRDDIKVKWEELQSRLHWEQETARRNAELLSAGGSEPVFGSVMREGLSAMDEDNRRETVRAGGRLAESQEELDRLQAFLPALEWAEASERNPVDFLVARVNAAVGRDNAPGPG